MGNLHSKFGHARPLGYRIISYTRDGRTDRQTDGRTKATLIGPFLRLGHNDIYAKYAVINVSQKTLIYLSNFRPSKSKFYRGTVCQNVYIRPPMLNLDLYIPDAEGFDRVSRTVAAPGCQSWAGGQGAPWVGRPTGLRMCQAASL